MAEMGSTVWLQHTPVSPSDDNTSLFTSSVTTLSFGFRPLDFPYNLGKIAPTDLEPCAMWTTTSVLGKCTGPLKRESSPLKHEFNVVESRLKIRKS